MSSVKNNGNGDSGNVVVTQRSDFVLQSSDHPGLVFVTQPLEEYGTNYFSWSKTMMNALKSKNKAGFVDGTVAKPDANSPDYYQWDQCNAIVLTWLINSLCKELQTGAAHAETAQDVWGDLKERFVQGLAPRLYELKRSVALLQQERVPVSTYYGKLKAVWNEMQALRPMPTCTCGAAKLMAAIKEEEKVFDFLMGLDDSFRTVRSQILSIQPLPNLGHAYSLIVGDEKQRPVSEARGPGIEAAAFVARADNGRKGHGNGPTRHGGVTHNCTHCGKANHTKETCYQLIGYPNGWGKRRTNGGRRGGDETNTGHSSSEFNYHVIPSNNDKFSKTISPSLIPSTQPAATYRFPLNSNTPSVYNQPKQSLSRINVKINPKKALDLLTATSTNVFPKSTSLSFYRPLPPQPSPTLGSSPSSPFGAISASPKSSPVSKKPILARATSTPSSYQTKNQYNVVEKGSTPLYVIPEDIKGLIRKDIVPGVLKKPLSPETYKDYFATLLYAEDYYREKWDGFEMKNVTLKLQEAEIQVGKDKSKNKNNNQKNEKIFVKFEVDSIPEKRPFLLSRDFASVRPAGRKVDPFQGIIFRVVRSNIVLVEFGDDFHAQHYSSCKYDVKFSFNRVCLKRAHQAIAAASDMLFTKFLFPDYWPNNSHFSENVSLTEKNLFSSHKLNSTAISRIINLNGSPAYLVEGPLSVTNDKKLSRTGIVLRDAVVQLSQASSDNRILICAPTNNTCDVFMRNLWKEIGNSNIFRANAAFRELDVVPIDILPFCPYKEKDEVFLCPSLSQLRKFKVILSTFTSSFRLHNEGIESGHFTHIFLVDGSSVIEPEILVPLTNLANVTTNIVVTGAPGNKSSWVRSNIARQNGLKTSYFERLRERKLYKDLNPESNTQLEDASSSSSSHFS